MNDVFECFLNRREVPGQEPALWLAVLEEVADAAMFGDVADRAAARIVVLDELRSLWRDDLSHREMVDMQRVAELLTRLGLDKEDVLSP